MANETVSGTAPGVAGTGDSAALPRGIDKHHLVFLEAVHLDIPHFDFPLTVTRYQKTAPEQIAERIKDATIVISNIANVTPADMDQAPHMQILAIYATGMGWVDKQYCARRGITVINCPQSNIDAVSEHFLALYFASRKRVPEVDWRLKNTSECVEKGSISATVWPDGAPLGAKQETLGIVGYGALGKSIEALARAVGMSKVIVAERRGRPMGECRDGRVPFEEVLQSATTIVVVCPRDDSTINLFDEAELKSMRKNALLINLARGGIVNEGALAKALKERWIFGAATDVFDKEPAGPGTSPLLPEPCAERVPNLIVSSHIAWYSGQTIQTLQNLMKQGIEAFVNGRLYDAHVKGQVAVHDHRIWK